MYYCDNWWARRRGIAPAHYRSTHILFGNVCSSAAEMRCDEQTRQTTVGSLETGEIRDGVAGELFHGFSKLVAPSIASIRQEHLV
jgi:hypothetical protein